MVLNTEVSELTSFSLPSLSSFWAYSRFSISDSNKYSPTQRHGNHLLVIFSSLCVYRDAVTYERMGGSLSVNSSSSSPAAAIFT
jgi:hypothetical protein